MDDKIDSEKLKQFAYRYHFNYISLELKDIEAFILSTDEFLAGKLKVNKQSSADEYSNSRMHPEVQFGSIFPDILWRTTFLHSYFYLESTLDQICKNLQQVDNHKLGLSDIAGNGIFRASVYLKKVCNIVEPFTDNTWSKLNDYNKLRNVFVHGNGICTREKAVGLAKRNNGLLIAVIDFDKIAIRFSKEFNFKVLQTIGDFFSVLQGALHKKEKS